MLTDNEAKVNHNKRLLESPSDPSNPKRTMLPNTSSSEDRDSNQTQEDAPLTINAFRQILKLELNASLDDKLAKLATKTDIDAVQHDVNHLQNRLQNHEHRLHQMEWKQRSKNIIFKYIPQKRNYKAYITSLLHNIMGLPNIYPRSIFSLKTLMDKKQAILLVEFMDNDEVREIFSKVNTLKGTNIILERDLSDEERQRKGVLLNIRKEILKRAKENNVSIKIVVSENRIKFGDDIFIHNKSNNEFQMAVGENGVDLREYLIDKFNLLVDINYSIIVNQ